MKINENKYIKIRFNGILYIYLSGSNEQKTKDYETFK